MLGIYVAGDSGAYLNPAITLANCVYRGLPFRRFPVYLLAQFLGGFVAAGVMYANYIASIDNFAGQGVRTSPPDPNATANIFCTFPAGAFLSTTNQFFSEFITSTLLIFVIFALKDTSNAGAFRSDGNWFPLSLFFLIFGLGACFGYETGYAINLARDFGPRVMAAAVGYSNVWSAGNYYFWIPIVASFLGCLFGGLLYDLFIYTGPESPLNTPFMGLPYLIRPDKYVKERWNERPDETPAFTGKSFFSSSPDEKTNKAV